MISRIGKLYYTDEEKERALQNNSALSYALSRGYDLVKHGSFYTMREHDSLVFRASDGKFFWNSQGKNGDALDFIQAFEGRSYTEAVVILAGTEGVRQMAVHREESSTQEKKELILPEADRNSSRIFAYLTRTRGIDPALVNQLIGEGKLFQCKTYSSLQIAGYDEKGEAQYSLKPGKENPLPPGTFQKTEILSLDGQNALPQIREGICVSSATAHRAAKEGKFFAYHNLAMAGLDERGIVRYLSLRSLNSEGKSFKLDAPGSDKSVPFVIPGEAGTDTVCVFESPIEAMSYRTLCGELKSPHLSCDMISTGGAASLLSLDRYLKEHPHIRTIVAGFNNDSKALGHEINAGQNGVQKIVEKYGQIHEVQVHTPHLNDWNDVLKNYRETLASRKQELTRSPPPVQRKPQKSLER